MTLSIDQQFLENVLTNLVCINSINPSLVPGAPGEAEIAAYVSGVLQRLGLEVRVHEPEPGRTSVVGRLPGSGGRSLMLNAHLDTVGVDDMPEPFAAHIGGGKLYGRGAFDMKGSLAAQIAAAKALVDSGVELEGDLLIAAVADEEYASMGTADLLNHYRPHGAIVTEPTSLELCLAHKGFVWLEVKTLGRAAHGSRFDLGIDANMRMGRFLGRLEALERDLRSRDPHPLVGPPSLHAAMLSGGTELSMYAAECTLGVERRTVPGETEAMIVDELQQIVDHLSAEDPSFEATVTPLLARAPFEVAPDKEIVVTVAEAAEQVLGRRPPQVGDTPWMDSALLAEAGVETVVIGPHGEGAHAVEEWVSLPSLNRLAAILATTTMRYCGVRNS